MILQKKRTRAGLIAATAVLTLLLGIVGITFGHGGTGLPLVVIAPCMPHSLVFVLPSLIINVPVALGLTVTIRKIINWQ